MAITVKVKTKEFDKLQGKMRGVEKLRALKKGGDWLRDWLRNERPAKKAGAFSAMATPGQKRAFWAKVRSGQARVDGQGYVRTGNTAGAWGSTATSGFKVIVENNELPAAYFLYDQKAQQPFLAASGWTRVDKVGKEKLPDVIKVIDSEIAKMLGN